MNLLPGNAQHIGDREDQQDSFGFSDFNDAQLVAHGGCLMVLADGMGGLANGAAASQMGVARFLTAYGAKQPAESIGDALSRALAAAQHAVAGCSGDAGDAGSTLVAAAVHDDRLYWISVGDSRLYLCRGQAPAVMLTTDHNLRTLLMQKVDRGEMDEGSLAQSGNLEALTEYLGSPQLLSPDLESEGVQMLPGDTVMACSDGLYRALPPEQMTQILEDCDAMTGAERLVDAVLQMRLAHQDNVTVVALQLVAAAEPEVAIIRADIGAFRKWVPGVLAGGLGVAAILAALVLFHVVTFGPRSRPAPVQPAAVTSPINSPANAPGGEAPAKTLPVQPPPAAPVLNAHHQPGFMTGTVIKKSKPQ